ncbi:MAG: M23 family metallopeptidase [Spirochaetales bacterium]|nr:M23 family metallopeptidase [Spirochaetales bacterium]
MSEKARAITFWIVSLTLFSVLSGWADSAYPRLACLKSSDILFLQLQDDIRTYYHATGYGKDRQFPALSFFAYTRQKDDTIFSLAARLNLPYETIATCNGLSQTGDFLERAEILIPNTPGIFVPDNPANALEEMMYSSRDGSGEPSEKIVIRHHNSVRQYFFFRGARFNALERAYFLRIIFHFPLEHAVRSSDFGPRPDPFTGRLSFHYGIDLAASLGSPVHAAREGVVKETGYNESYGKFVLVSHPGGYETRYGHLSVIVVKNSEKVTSSTVLGKVGMTGHTTGPHLHFEILKNGKPIDPSTFLP